MKLLDISAFEKHIHRTFEGNGSKKEGPALDSLNWREGLVFQVITVL